MRGAGHGPTPEKIRRGDGAPLQVAVPFRTNESKPLRQAESGRQVETAPLR